MSGATQSAASQSSNRSPPAPQDRRGPGADGVPDRRRRGRVLIVEDDYLVALSSEMALLDAEFDVLGVCASGEAALEQALATRPDLVLMDIRLAGAMDGIETALALREHGIPCLFASANSDPGMVARGHAAMPLGWLRKPFSEAALVAMVEESFQKLQGQ